MLVGNDLTHYDNLNNICKEQKKIYRIRVVIKVHVHQK